MASIFSLPGDVEKLLAEQVRTNALLTDIFTSTMVLNVRLLSLLKIARQFMPPKNPVGVLEFVPLFNGVDFVKYKVTLPQLPDGDTNNADAVAGELRQTFSGVPQSPISTTIGQTTIESIDIPSGTSVTADFVFVDAAGNVSSNPVVAAPFIVPDTIPPPSPVGELIYEPIG